MSRWFSNIRGTRCRNTTPAPSDSAVITVVESNITRMAPCVVSAHAVATDLDAGDYHTARYQWSVNKISGAAWTPLTCLDPRPGLQEGDSINSATECEGFNFAFFADVAGTYRITLTVTDEDFNSYSATEDIVVAADTRTALYVSASGDDTTGDGSIGSPWRQPSRAWEHVVTNGKANFNVLLEKGGTYTGFNNGHGSNDGCSNIYIGSYGSGAVPILKWSTALYPTGRLLNMGNYEGVVVRGLNFRGNDADNIHGICVTVGNECLNIGFVDITYGGPSDTEEPTYFFNSEANLTNNAVPAYQGRGYCFFNCSGHSSAYFVFSGAADIIGHVNTAGFTPTTTEFECDLNGLLNSTNDVYNGMEVVLEVIPNRNLRYTVLDYVGNTGSGRSKFTLSSALAAAPTNGEDVRIASINDVGDSYIFMFGCHGWATANKGSEVRVRLINDTLMTAVGSVMDGSTTAGVNSKSGFRLMVDYCYLYRCAELNGGVQIGVEQAASGLGPHTYMVMDRTYMGCLDVPGKVPFNFEICSKVMVKACVGKGSLAASQETNAITVFSNQTNAAGEDIRIAHCSLFMNVWSDGLYISDGQGLTGETYWPAGFLTYENNLQIHGAVDHYTDFIRDPFPRAGGSTASSMASAKNNVYSPDPHGYGGGGGQAFSKPGVSLNISEWNAEAFADSEVYGTITADVLIAADYVPDPGTYIPETTNRTFVSKGVFQDYYGRSFSGGAYAGAVGKAI